jgi:hypothetical protein
VIALLATAAAAEGPDASEAARLSDYYERRLRSNAELVEERWTVMEGGLALTSGAFAERVGDDAGLRRLDRHRKGWLVVAGTTAAAGVAWMAFGTLPWLSRPTEPPDASPFLGLVAGPVVAAFPVVAIHLASRPKHAPVSAFYEEADADALIEGYNRSVAEALDLDPAALP